MDTPSKERTSNMKLQHMRMMLRELRSEYGILQARLNLVSQQLHRAGDEVRKDFMIEVDHVIAEGE